MLDAAGGLRSFAGRGPVRPITETCIPCPDVRSGGLTDNHFAAQLDQVVRNPQDYEVYDLPAIFDTDCLCS